MFDLQAGMVFANVLDDLDSGALRIGIRVQGFAGGGSESFANNGVIPEPASLAIWSLLGAAGIAVGFWRRRKAG